MPFVKARVKTPLIYSLNLPPVRFAEAKEKSKLQSQRLNAFIAKVVASILIMAGLPALSVTAREVLQLKAQLMNALSVKAQAQQ
ncbi:MAG: hypothetical protein QMD44_12580 [Thermodesulfovibrionales bacterium]|nr:hypothetical protein [Thermodesulfovibrionales bacterium]